MDKQGKKDRTMQYKERKITGGIYAIKNTMNGKRLVLPASDLQGSKNRFSFAQQTNSCMNLKLKDDWDKYGGSVFAFEVLELLEKKESQTVQEFADDVKTLEALWYEKLTGSDLY